VRRRVDVVYLVPGDAEARHGTLGRGSVGVRDEVDECLARLMEGMLARVVVLAIIGMGIGVGEGQHGLAHPARI